MNDELPISREAFAAWLDGFHSDSFLHSPSNCPLACWLNHSNEGGGSADCLAAVWSSVARARGADRERPLPQWATRFVEVYDHEGLEAARQWLRSTC